MSEKIPMFNAMAINTRDNSFDLLIVEGIGKIYLVEAMHQYNMGMFMSLLFWFFGFIKKLFHNYFYSTKTINIQIQSFFFKIS